MRLHHQIGLSINVGSWPGCAASARRADRALAGGGRLHSRPNGGGAPLQGGETVAMTAEVSGAAAMPDAAARDRAALSDARTLRRLIMALGLGWSALF